MKTLRSYLLLAAILLFGAPSFAQTAQEKAAFDKIVTATRSIKSMTSDFTETKHLKMLSEDVVTAGKLWYKSPSWMRWEYDSRNYGVLNPKGAYMVKDGQRNGALSRGFGQTGKMVTSLMSGLSQDLKDYSVSYSKSGNSLTVTAVPVSPRMKGVVDSVVMIFDIPSSTIKSFEIRSSSGFTHIDFNNLKKDAEVDMQLFN
ncbi:MAG: outer membrane lipoprotein carrier protein LolA [Bacteroidales bacterium]|nr:outer membrane lipoprotein carrier protein LolA [Bacteroidales bacterium]MBP5517522.1 outer membrane lipoprotein carrier protein LolA [Bacteroidales bacterium]